MINYERIEKLTNEYAKLPAEILEYLSNRLSDVYLSSNKVIPWNATDTEHKTAILTALYDQQNEVSK